MKIVLTPAGCYKASGAYLCACELAVTLKEKYNVQVFVILPQKGDGIKILKENNINYFIIKSYSWLIPVKNDNYIKSTWNYGKLIIKTVLNVYSKIKIKKLLKKIKPDIVHINELGTYVAAEVSENLNIPTVWHFREFNEEDQGFTIWRKKLANQLFNNADKIFCVSNSIYNKFSKVYPNASMQVIYDGVKKENFRYIKHKPENSINIICVGALYYHKRQYILIQAAEKIKNRCNKKIHIYFLGEGYAKNNYINLVNKLNLKDIISFEGFHSDISKFYELADIAVVPSVNEAFGRVTVEAMLSGTHVIGSDSGGTGELISLNYGTIFKHDDVDDLAEKLIYVIENDTYRIQIAENARKYAEKKFTVERNAEEIYNEYKKILRI